MVIVFRNHGSASRRAASLAESNQPSHAQLPSLPYNNHIRRAIAALLPYGTVLQGLRRNRRSATLNDQSLLGSPGFCAARVTLTRRLIGQHYCLRRLLPSNEAQPIYRALASCVRRRVGQQRQWLPQSTTATTFCSNACEPCAHGATT